MKQCSKCKIFSDNFGKHKHTKDKLASWCRLCKNIQTNTKKDSQMQEKLGHVSRIINQRKSEAKKQSIPFEIDSKYAMEIAKDICPVLGLKLSWCERKGKATDNSPSLDKFKPELGYVPGNVCWISFKANTMKQRATALEVQALANWMKQIEKQ